MLILITFANENKKIPTGTKKKEKIKVLDTANKIINFNEQNQQRSDLKI